MVQDRHFCHTVGAIGQIFGSREVILAVTKMPLDYLSIRLSCSYILHLEFILDYRLNGMFAPLR